ncbi:MAG: hypothetical protein QF544_07130 [Candidatus Thalassarchaeaceae archaeon]|nr:hypothetical protein [Candidatus Thalassarchaeaceae archaeon]
MGFSEDALEFYQYLRDNQYSTNAYNSRKIVFHDEIKPALTALLDEAASVIVPTNSDIQHPDTERLGSPHNQGGPSGFAWGALTRNNKNRRNDLQLFVALRPQSIRVGLYVSRKFAKPVFQRTIRNIYREPEKFCELLDELFSCGILMCEPCDNRDLGHSNILEYERDCPNIAIGENNELDLFKSFTLEDGSNKEFVDEVINVFSSLIPMREFLLK